MKITREPYVAEVVDFIDPVSRTRTGFRFIVTQTIDGQKKKIYESPVTEDSDYCLNRAEDYLEGLREVAA